MKSKEEIRKMDFTQLHDAYLKQALSPVEVTEAYIEKLEQDDPVLNGYANPVPELALAEAKESEMRYRKGEALSVLDGIPYGAKDLMETKDIRTCFGSEIYKDYVPEKNATIIDKLQVAGMVLLGKTNTHQFAMGVTSDCEFTGITRNPYNHEHGCGGSSGGSGCVLAADMAPAALGTDTGGSIRIPASYCGIVGMKPTFGSVSAAGIMPLSYSLDHVGPMTRGVKDNALLLNEMVGYDPQYDKSIVRKKEDFTRNIGKSIRGIRVGVLMDYVESDPVQSGVMEGFQKGLKRIKELGGEVSYVPTPEKMKEYRRAHKEILAAEAHQIHREDLQERRELIDPSVLNRLLAAEMSADDFITLQRLQAEFKQVSAEMFQDIDVLVLPSTAITASKVRNPMIDVNGVEMPIWELATHFTWLGDLNGYPAISIPIAFSAGLPVGFQIMGKPYEEARIYQIAEALE